jgi:hypothetical protein
MPQQLANSLRQTVDLELRHLNQITDTHAAFEPHAGHAWSAKQELGHLIDSATNNHVRFVQAATAVAFPVAFTEYPQNAWVVLHAYEAMAWTGIVDFWSQYNYFLADLIAKIPAPALEHTCTIGTETPITLRFLIEDYLVHLQHHLDHVLSRPVVTAYPRQ